MIDFIIDLAKCFWFSIVGNGRQRKIAGAAAFLILLSISFTAFTAWISQPRYQDILQGVSLEKSWGISIAIALGMAFMISKTAYDLYRFIWFKIELPASFKINVVLILALGTFDVIKNFEGSTDRAFIEMVVNEHKQTGAELPFAKEIQTLRNEKQAIYKRYTWKGKLHFAQTKYHPEFPQDRLRMDQIENKLSSLEVNQTQTINDRDSQVISINARNAEKQGSSETGLRWLSGGVYILQFLIGFCWVALLDELDGQIDGNISPTLSDEPMKEKKVKVKKKKKKTELFSDDSLEPKEAKPDREKVGFSPSYKTVKPKELKPKTLGVHIKEETYKTASENVDIITDGKGQVKLDEKLDEILNRITDLETRKNSAKFTGISSSKKNPELPVKKEEKTFHFYASKPPVNIGKNYDMTSNEMRKVKKVVKCHEFLLKKYGINPSIKDVALKAKMTEKTASKWMKLAGLIS